LFHGESGTGKSFFAKVLASEINRKMYHIKYYDLFSEDITNPNDLLYSIFYNIIERAKTTKEPCIIFLDEIEKIISSIGDYSPDLEQIISNTIIKNITNIQKSELDIIVVAALHKKNSLDQRFSDYALFDNQFFFDKPKAPETKRLFELYIQEVESKSQRQMFDKNIDWDCLVKKTDGFSARYIKQIINVCVKECFFTYIDSQSQQAQQTLITQDIVLSKIDELKNEEKIKGKSAGY